MGPTSDHAEERSRSVSVTAHASSQAQEVEFTLASDSRRRSRKSEHHRPDDLPFLLNTVVLVRGWTALGTKSKDSWRRGGGRTATLELFSEEEYVD